MFMTGTRFDLSAEAARARKNSGLIRYILTAALGVLAVTIGDQVWTVLIPASSPTVRAIAVALIVFLAALLILDYWAVFYAISPSATELNLDSQGLTLLYSRNRSVRVLWKSPSFKLKLVRFLAKGSGMGGQPLTEWVSMVGPTGRITYITPQAADAIVAAAKTRGLSVGQREKVTDDGREVQVRLTPA